MANTFKFGTNGNWAVKDGYALAYNDENNNFKPLPFDFTRASSATRVNKQGLIETVGSGKPRIDFTDNTDGHLLLEPSRTNLATYSEGFSNWSIISSGVVVTDNTTDVLSPSGKNDASKVEFNAASKILGQSPTLSGNYSGFVYVKGTQGETIRFNFGGTEENFTLTGGWDKLERTNITATANAFNLNTYGGATARTIYVYGAQLESGSYATSYIPTEGSSVTRVVETCKQDLSQVVSSNTHTFYIEGLIKHHYGVSDGHLFSFSSSDTSAATAILFYRGGNKIKFYGQNGGTPLFGAPLEESGTSDENIVAKYALAIENNRLSIYRNGTKIISSTATQTIPTNLKWLQLDFWSGGAALHTATYKDLRYYDTALTDTELQNLTT